MKEVQSALNTAAADDSKLVLLSAVGSIFCCGLDFIYFIRRLTDDRKKESTKMAEAIRYVRLSPVIWLVVFFISSSRSQILTCSDPVPFYLGSHFMCHVYY